MTKPFTERLKHGYLMNVLLGDNKIIFIRPDILINFGGPRTLFTFGPEKLAEEFICKESHAKDSS